MVDPLVMPVGAMRYAGVQVFHILCRLRDELGVNSTCGASNISFGLPNRHGINSAFLAMAIANGLSSAITNPLEREIVNAIKAADVLTGNDRDCVAWIRTFRDPALVGGRRTRRRTGRAPGRRGRVVRTMATAPVQVIFTPSGRRGEVEVGTTVLEAARHLGVDIDSVCGGRGLCGRCQVTLGASAAVGIPATEDRLSAPDAIRGSATGGDAARYGTVTGSLAPPGCRTMR